MGIGRKAGGEKCNGRKRGKERGRRRIIQTARWEKQRDRGGLKEEEKAGRDMME